MCLVFNILKWPRYFLDVTKQPLSDLNYIVLSLTLILTTEDRCYVQNFSISVI